MTTFRGTGLAEEKGTLATIESLAFSFFFGDSSSLLIEEEVSKLGDREPLTLLADIADSVSLNSPLTAAARGVRAGLLRTGCGRVGRWARFTVSMSS